MHKLFVPRTNVQPIPNHKEKMSKIQMIREKLASKWARSLFKLCYRELIIYLVLFKSISCIQNYVLDRDQLNRFKKWVEFFHSRSSTISLPFLLGFYLTIIAQRWWQQYLVVPWPDRLMMAISMYIGRPKDEKSKHLRRVLMRRSLLMLVLIFRHVSDTVRKRFPTFHEIVQFGVMTKAEKLSLESIVTDLNLFWVPGCWFVSNLQDAINDRTLTDPIGIKLIMEEFLEFRSKCGLLWSYYWIQIPKVYGQVVKMAVYSFFAIGLVGRQCIESPEKQCFIERSIPVGTILELFVYLGLIKAADQMICPFGDDDEDFDLNFLIDRHAKAINLNVELLTDNYPPVEEIASSPLVIFPHKPLGGSNLAFRCK